jgi:hypothetical protein
MLRDVKRSQLRSFGIRSDRYSSLFLSAARKSLRSYLLLQNKRLGVDRRLLISVIRARPRSSLILRRVMSGLFLLFFAELLESGARDPKSI